MNNDIKFIDLETQRIRIEHSINDRITNIHSHGSYIMGPEVFELESMLANYTSMKYCVTCANGSDAIQIALMALKIEPGDQVFVPSFTFSATAESILILGATPIFVDVEKKSFNICCKSLVQRIEENRTDHPNKQKVIIAVDLFGRPANYPDLEEIASHYNIALISDAAQSFGAKDQNNNFPSKNAVITTTSFFPAKPLGCYGDGGAIFTSDSKLANLMRSIRSHGKGSDKYDNVRLGMNSRLDTIQAAILLEKITILDEEIAQRQKNAELYDRILKKQLNTPDTSTASKSAWAQYTITSNDRNKIISHLSDKSIPTAIYYPTPMHKQTAYKDKQLRLPTSEYLSERVFSIPIHPYLTPETINYIGAEIKHSLI
ncbi:DegT/DnrJ/EryC1/StrS family aminotransferase [Kiloniella majae]|uniref:DegT/DnrJ/EryC1/StrS family aminotransferase n=1 Tax=Kiloniella majae TaxID=1938558 RepID=UPI001C3F5768|nr:DegT/DnrJ/EryC1/StrS family aminotransferase [Kiloniella majae]